LVYVQYEIQLVVLLLADRTNGRAYMLQYCACRHRRLSVCRLYGMYCG